MSPTESMLGMSSKFGNTSSVLQFHIKTRGCNFASKRVAPRVMFTRPENSFGIFGAFLFFNYSLEASLCTEAIFATT